MLVEGKSALQPRPAEGMRKHEQAYGQDEQSEDCQIQNFTAQCCKIRSLQQSQPHSIE